MQALMLSVVTVMALAVSPLVCGADINQDDVDRLSRHLAVVRSFEYGQDDGPLQEIERLVLTLSPASPWREPVEQQLIAALQSATTRAGKDFLCRQLRVVGTARAVPVMETLLADPEAASPALSVLGTLECPEAAQALRRALDQVAGERQVGIVDALADRRDAEAMPQMIQLLQAEDAAVVRAAVRAVGRIGGADGAAALQHARAAAGPELAMAIDHALLECAQTLVAGGARDEAARIYEGIRRTQPARPFQLAALKGLVTTRPDAAARLLVDAAQQDQGAHAADAIAVSALAPGQDVTRALIQLRPALPANTQILLLRALGNRRDPVAVPALAEAAASADEAVRLAALEALGCVGDAAALDTLLVAGSAGGAGQRVAQASLLQLEGEAVNRRLLELVDQADEQTRVAAIDALAGRGATTATARLLAAATQEPGAVRQAAIRALGTLAQAAELDPLLQLVAKPKSPEDRELLIAATGRLLPRCGDLAGTVDTIVQAIRTAPTDARPALVRILGATGAEAALPVLRDQLQSAPGDVQDAVVMAMSEWPDGRVLEDLLRVLETARRAPQRETALRGLVRLAATAPDSTQLYARMWQSVAQVPDKKLVLTSLGMQAQSAAALELARAHLHDPELGPTAGVAAVRIANRLRDSDPTRARAALRQVIEQVDHDDVRRRARDVLNEVDKYEGHILSWVGAGPFVVKGKTGDVVYQTVFDPEHQDAKGIEWKPITQGLGSWDVNLEATFGGLDHCAAYLRTRIWSPVEADAVLELGCDDAIKAWLNGQEVYSQWTEHAAAPRQHQAEVRLNQGWNELMLKVVDQGGGWIAACRIRARDGSPIEGLNVSAE